MRVCVCVCVCVRACVCVCILLRKRVFLSGTEKVTYMESDVSSRMAQVPYVLLLLDLDLRFKVKMLAFLANGGDRANITLVIYLPSNGITANVVHRDLDLHFSRSRILKCEYLDISTGLASGCW